MFHIQIPLVFPGLAGNVPEPGAYHHQRGVPVRKRSDYPRSSPDLAVHSFDHIVGADSRPVLSRKIHIRKSFLKKVDNCSEKLKGAGGPAPEWFREYVNQSSDERASFLIQIAGRIPISDEMLMPSRLISPSADTYEALS